ncbi:alanine racemase [Rhodobacterales bacterium 52_120_T64]|nr:alanine racemase [Rhodobacterales bacterium 52_120_T64]
MPGALLTIDLGAVAANWRALDAKSANTVETGAVIKANAYGLGVGPVGRALQKAGAKTFFVALAAEGVVLRQAIGPTARIFVFSGYMQGDESAFDEFDLTPLLNSADQVVRYLTHRHGAEYGLQLDSGMNRLGMESPELVSVIEHFPAIDPVLTMSHLACADEPEHPQNLDQLTAFNEMAATLTSQQSSLSATGGILLGADYHMDITRPGIGLYGGEPFMDARPVVTLSLPVIQTRPVAVGESVGYGATWVAPRPSTIATVAGGYADGLIRAMGSNASLYAGDTRCPIVGRVSMDLITVDVTDLAQVPASLDILNTTQTVDVLADAAGTIGYEILTSLGNRYQRVYKD